MTLLKISDYKVMPWKNGLGITSQIDIFPKNSEFPGEDFLWRMSSASVKNNNPFSQFPGCDRFLAVFEGEGLRLNGKDLLSSQVLHFQGEESIQGDLIGGPVLDIGLIYRREKVRASMTFAEVSRGQTLDLSLNHETHYVFCAQGSLQCQNFEVSAPETLKIDQPGQIQITNRGSQTVKIYLIQLSRR